MICGGSRCPRHDDDAAVTTTDLGSDQAPHQLDGAPDRLLFSQASPRGRRRRTCHNPLLRAAASASAGQLFGASPAHGPGGVLPDIDISTSTSAAALAVSHVRPRTAMY